MAERPADETRGQRKRIDWRRALFCALASFLLSRSLILLATLLVTGTAEAPLPPLPGDRRIITVSGERLAETLDRLVVQGDAGWYRGIAEDGYAQRPFDDSRQENWAFFPLHPLLWRAASSIIGDSTIAALLWSNLIALLAMLALHVAAQSSGRDLVTADRAVFVLALFPTSYFLSLPWSEALFLLTSAGAWALSRQNRWGGSAALGIAASATRVSGAFLLPAIAMDLWQRDRRVLRSAWPLALIPLGIAGFMAWLWWISGNPLAFADIQSAWGRFLGLPIRAIGIIALHPDQIAVDWNVRYINFAALLLGLLAIRHFVYRREYGLALLIAAGVLLPAMTDNLTSMARYALGCFPLMIAIADWLGSPMRERSWFALSAALLLFMSGALAMGYSFAAC
ncbi:MAG: hypothetical protein H7A20_05130 [Rhodanobacteraceae bacterium]|nr:hypothetical protein [Xanthomonadales bacterium]MCP5478150.1 hypothetical protein [Rhodanobacteraceae bacterium]